ncbi:MAG: alpha/beta fold hydrolase [Promethearchaeota archaeon]
MPTIRVNDINIYYEIHGEGFPFIMILGLSCDVNWWSPEVIKAIAQSFKTIVFDNRGVGRTDKPEIAYSIKMFADDTIGLMDVLNIQKAHILGFSMGGFIAQEITLNYPERVANLILCSTHCGGSKSLPPSNEVMNFLINPPEDNIDLINGFIPLLFTKTFIENSPEFIESYKQQMLKIPIQLSSHHRQLQAMSFNAARRLKEIEKPTLILQGKEDILIPPGNAEILAKGISGAKLIMLENAAHLFFQPEPQRVVKLIKEFLYEKN